MNKSGYLLIVGILFSASIFLLARFNLNQTDGFNPKPYEEPVIFYYEEHVTNWFPIFNLSTRCPNSCFFTKDTEYYNRSNAVIFFRTLRKPPPPKFEHQTWIFFTFESPNRTRIPKPSSQWGKHLDKFDWLMSYRPYSDIYIPFGRLQKLPDEYSEEYNFSNIYRNKERDVAWLVSHCNTPSKRERYIQELRKYINVDIYGGCGDKRCPVSKTKTTNVESLTKCKAHISRYYKFYLAFENSICEHYSTEKLYGMYERDNLMVPVVRGDPKVSQFFSPGTFISAYNFTSPKRLGLYLRYIGASEARYIAFLKEKLKYNVTLWTENYYQSICELCTRLHTSQGKLPRDKNFNLVDILFADKCYSPFDIFR